MKLLDSIKINQMEIKNRVVMAPMGLTGARSNGSYSEQLIRFYAHRAKGGTGLIITGLNNVAPEYEPYRHHLLNSTRQVPQLSMLVDRCHVYGAKVCVQISPGMGRMYAISPTDPPWSASPTFSFWYPELLCRPLSIYDIHYLADRVGYSCSLAKDAGADAVELHAGGIYLLDQFMTERFNLRTDEYGGCLDNRLRFLQECIAAMRRYCGRNFPLLVKYSPDHMYDAPGYRKLDEGVEIAKRLEQWGVDALHVEPGCYEVWYKQVPTIYQKPGCQREAAAAVKAAVSIPVIVQGKLNEPELAEQVLQAGQADMIAMGHQLLADPDVVAKIEQQRSADIRHCIGCNECIYSIRLSRICHCTVNPQLMYEDVLNLQPVETAKSMLVIGGGAGGMQASLSAAQRGIQVELWEKSQHLGGLMLSAGHSAFKRDIMLFNQYLQRQIEKSSVKLVYNKEAILEEVIATVRQRGIDRVVVATGSRPAIPRIPGVEKALIAENVILGLEDCGDSAVIIGGGLVGCECALDLAYQGKKVYVIERHVGALTIEKLEADATNNRFSLRDMLIEAGVEVLSNASTTEIGDGKVYYSDENGQTKFVECHSVILATGYHNVDTLSCGLREAGIDCVVIGDAVRAGKIIHAIRGGFDAAFSM